MYAIDPSPRHRAEPLAALGQRLLDAGAAFAPGVARVDDVTMVLVRRDASPTARA